jgi:hypothetical protein
MQTPIKESIAEPQNYRKEEIKEEDFFQSLPASMKKLRQLSIDKERRDKEQIDNERQEIHQNVSPKQNQNETEPSTDFDLKLKFFNKSKFRTQG